MKRAIFILTLGLCLLLSDGAHAQRALPAMRGLEIRGGMADGFYTRDSRSETGYWFGLAMSRYAKNADKWVFGAEFLNRYYPYKSERIPVAQFTAEGGYYYKFLADPSRTFFFYLGGSALAGYESVNRGERRLFGRPSPPAGCAMTALRSATATVSSMAGPSRWRSMRT